MTNRKPISETEIKALLTRLTDSQAQYPADLLARRRYMFVSQVPPAGIFIGNKAIYNMILQGIRSTAGPMTMVVILALISITAFVTVLAANNPGWIHFIPE